MSVVLQAAALAAGMLVAMLLTVAGRRLWRRLLPDAVPPRRATATYVIDGTAILDADFGGRRILERGEGPDGMARLRAWLSRHFADSGDLLVPAAARGDHQQLSEDRRLALTREVCGDAVRLTVAALDEDPELGGQLVELAAQEDRSELRILRANIDHAPYLMWRVGPSDEITWINRAYLDAARERHGAERLTRWPIPQLFDGLDMQTGGTRRVSLRDGESGDFHWFDCQAIEVAGELLFTAVNMDDVVRAEARLRDVTQTMTKTFADLASGLVVFDRRRYLTLFNPALSEITTLAPDFLMSRPSLTAFLDALREARMMPEPRDYKSWRDAIAALEEAAVDGTFEETWALPGNQTWRVSGRPHPDGAIAFLFEDISLEMSLTRRFRGEIEQAQEILDQCDEAMVVFGIDGTATQANLAYAALWGVDDPAEVMGETVAQATQRWHARSVPTPAWGDFRDFARQSRERMDWAADVRLTDGRRLSCRFAPLANGATLARFLPAQGSADAVRDEVRRAG